MMTIVGVILILLLDDAIAQPCGHSVNVCSSAGLSDATWCDCCDAVACNASIGVAIRLSWLDCLRRGWCAAGGGPCRHTPRCDDLDSALAQRQNELAVLQQVTDATLSPPPPPPTTTTIANVDSTTLGMGEYDRSWGSVLFVCFVIVLACLAGIAITKIDLVSMGIS